MNRADGQVVKEDEIKLIKNATQLGGDHRGAVTFLDSMVSGRQRAKLFRGNISGRGRGASNSTLVRTKIWERKTDKVFIGFAVLLGIGFSVGLFILLPTLIAGFLVPASSSATHG